jgi:hypothetical protein
MKEADRAKAGKKANDARKSYETPIVIDGKTGKNSEHGVPGMLGNGMERQFLTCRFILY